MIKQINKINLPYVLEPALHAIRHDGHQIVAIKKEAAAVTRLQTLVLTGSINESDSNNGVSHFLEHLLFKGTDNYGPSEIDKILESYGAIINAGTSKDYTQYHITLPTKSADIALKMHFDMLFNATLPEDEIGNKLKKDDEITEENLMSITRERSVVVEEIKMGLDNPMSVGQKHLFELIYAGHPYSRSIIGSIKNIATITRDEILDYYKKWYSPEYMITVVVSDLDTNDVITLVDKELTRAHNDRYPENNPTMPPAYEMLAEHNSTTKIVEQEVAQDYILWGIKTMPSKDIKATVAGDIISFCLGDGRSSRLIQRLIEDITDSPFIDIMSGAVSCRDSGSFLCVALINPLKRDEAEELFKREMIKLFTDDPLTDAEVRKCKTRIKSSFAADTETAQNLANEFVYSFAISGSVEYYAKYLETLECIETEYINSIIKEYLGIVDFSKIIITNSESVVS